MWRVFGEAEKSLWQFLDTAFGKAICVFHTDQQVQTTQDFFSFSNKCIASKSALILNN